jgi:hypothetical protein
MQANGAEMLRLACCLLTEQGIQVCAPIHDAVLIEVPVADMVPILAKVQDIMAAASAVVLDGFILSTDKMCITETTPWEDEKGKRLWDCLIKCLLPSPSAVNDDRELRFVDSSAMSSSRELTYCESVCHE